MQRIVPSPLTSSFLVEMSQVGHICWQRQWTPGTAGNFSVRQDDIVWSSPSGQCKGSLCAQSFLPVSMKTEKALVTTGKKPSLELSVHLGLYRAFPKARAVVHGHTPHLVAAIQGKTKLKFENQEMLKAIGVAKASEVLEVPILENLDPKRFVEYSKKKVLKDGLQHGLGFVVLANHGAYVCGSTPRKALEVLEGLEFLCRTGVSKL